MKIALILLSLPLLAADAPKPVALPDSEQAKIAKAWKAYTQFSAQKQILELQTEANNKALAAAQAVFDAALKESIAAHGCASISEALECVPAPKAEPKADAKKEK